MQSVLEADVLESVRQAVEEMKRFDNDYVKIGYAKYKNYLTYIQFRNVGGIKDAVITINHFDGQLTDLMPDYFEEGLLEDVQPLLEYRLEKSKGWYWLESEFDQELSEKIRIELENSLPKFD